MPQIGPCVTLVMDILLQNVTIVTILSTCLHQGKVDEEYHIAVETIGTF